MIRCLSERVHSAGTVSSGLMSSRGSAFSVQPPKVGRKVGRLLTRINIGSVQPPNLSKRFFRTYVCIPATSTYAHPHSTSQHQIWIDRLGGWTEVVFMRVLARPTQRLTVAGVDE